MLVHGVVVNDADYDAEEDLLNIPDKGGETVEHHAGGEDTYADEDFTLGTGEGQFDEAADDGCSYVRVAAVYLGDEPGNGIADHDPTGQNMNDNWIIQEDDGNGCEPTPGVVAEELRSGNGGDGND